jgi:D-alanyl-lipoteichoic acid acyltransferase DltB (MBOAT superfamily)
MALQDILVFTAAAVLYRLVFVDRGRKWVIFISSVLAVYWLQPLTPIRYLDFWLPTLTLGITVFIWILSSQIESRLRGENLRTGIVLIGIVIMIGLTRFVNFSGILTASRPPQFGLILIALIILILIASLSAYFTRRSSIVLWFSFALLIVIFLVLKIPALSKEISAALRMLMDQSTTSALATDIRWLGFSYVAFRLIHVVRDAQRGRLRVFSLQEFVNYVIFFPAIVAGPIDKIDRFSRDMRVDLTRDAEDFGEAGKRIAIGVFKKFVLADTIALIALSPINASQIRTAGWAWVLLYAYTFQIFFDFSGYTDIAIGIGRLLGFKLPENFKLPYLRENLALFWNNWHMTLTQWFRAYFFNPITRFLRKRARTLPPYQVIFITQISTMLLIGLWHGVTWNFALWGVWHGLGLFIQNRWSEWIRPRTTALEDRKFVSSAIRVLNIGLTFNYVALGWIWFALPEPELSWQVMLKLFGLA